MRLVDLDFVREGEILGKPIYSSEGKILLGEGIVLTEEYLNRLREMEISSVYISDDRFADVEIKDVINPLNRIEAIKVTREAIEQIKTGKNIVPVKMNKAVNNIVDDLLSNESILVNMVDIKSLSDYTFNHSVNVAVLSVIIGISLGYDQVQLRNLGVGALLHDIGKIKVAEEILHKKDSLTPEEFEEVKKHCEYGLDIIRENRELSILSAHIAYQHHERYDGSGYPRGLKGEEITEFSRIVSIAHVYDALMSDRPYRKRVLPHQAWEYIMTYAHTQFDGKIVPHFLKQVAPYPNGSIVQLNTKEKAVVVSQNIDCLLRPIVQVFEYQGKPVSRPFHYDLVINPTVFIEEVAPRLKAE